MLDPVCFAFDVTPDRSSASIGAAGLRPDGLPHVELVERGRGTGWVAERLVELTSGMRRSRSSAIRTGRPGRSSTRSRRLGVEVRSVTAKEHANACGLIFDLVEQGGLRHLGQGELEAALKAATRRPLGDAWAWSRKGGVDIAPLVSATLAVWGSATLQAPTRMPLVALV
jgi:hypothetical protein